MATAPFVISNAPIMVGDPLPWIKVRLHPAGDVNLEQFGGLRTALLFLGSANDQRVKAILAKLGEIFEKLRRDLGPSDFALVPVFGDAAAIEDPAVKAWLDIGPVVLDRGLALFKAFGIAAGNTVRIAGFVTDPQLIVRHKIEFTTADRFTASVDAAIRSQWGKNSPFQAPVLTIPDVFSPAECAGLIAHYQASVPEPSGYMMKSADGKYHLLDDPARKVRKDVILDANSELFASVMERLRRRVFMQIRRYFMFETVALERILLARYSAAEGGHFRKHRDFGDHGSHREFGLTMNLNDDFQGGYLGFPEFPGERHKPPPGAALLYSGAITHVVEPVTAGERYCLLSFLMGHEGLAKVEKYKAQHGEAIAAHAVPGNLSDAFSGTP